MNPLEITLLILLVTIIAFVSGKVPFSVISTGIILALILTGIKTGRIYGDFDFENWFHVLILCCER